MSYSPCRPLSAECKQTTMNVVFNQLHASSWKFLKAFEVLCHYLQTTPIINKFMYFYQLKHGPKVD